MPSVLNCGFVVIKLLRADELVVKNCEPVVALKAVYTGKVLAAVAAAEAYQTTPS